jgi:hypothetical protein
MKKRILITWILMGITAGCSGWYSSQGDIYFQDDFSKPSSGWDRVSGSDGITDYADGKYRIFSFTADYYIWATTGRNFPADVRIEVDVEKKAGPDQDVFGILCRYRNEKNFYILMISGDGQAGIARRTPAGEMQMLSGDSMTVNPNIHPGLEINHLRADCAGTNLALYVNDVLVASAANAEITRGDAGLWLGAYDRPGSDLYFDDFIVRKP